MKNPGFQDYFLAVLNQLEKVDFLSRRDLIDHVAVEMNLSKNVRAEYLPSQNQPTYANRIGWALTYLGKAGLISSPSRGVWKITNEGLKVQKDPPKDFKIKYLSEINPDFNDFKNSKRKKKSFSADEELSPDELLIENYEIIRQAVYEELLDKILSNTPDFFEKLVIDLLLKMGYGDGSDNAGRKLGRSGDEGIDGIISQDKLGLDIIYLQAKRWSKGNNVGRRDIQQFVGALSGQNANKGVFITTSNFTSEARDYQPKNDMKMSLIDGQKLASLLYEYEIGVSEERRLILKKLDNDYFEY